MIKKLIVPLALAALAAASCVKDARLSDNADLGVNFRITSGALTKATPTTVANLSAFKVTAIGNSASYFTDLNVAVTSAGVCTPEKTYYWPGYELGFYAYANPSGGTVSITNAAKGVAGVTPVAAAADQQDFVVAYNTGTKADNMASGVALNFRHALSQIKVKATNKSTAGLKINVKGVKVANVKESGDFSYPTAVTSGNNAATLDFALWNTGSASKTTYSIGGATEATPVVLSSTAADIMFSGASWMLVPQQLTAWNLTTDKTNANSNSFLGVYLQILDSADNQLYPATAGEYAYANVPIDTKWEPGKTYTYTLNFLDEAAGGGAGVDDNGDPVLGSPINLTLTIDNWDGYIDYETSNDMTDLLVETPVKTTIGGLEIAPGPLMYEGGKYVIKDNWNIHSFRSVFGKNEGSTYFSYLDMGKLFEKTDFTINDGDIENNLDPLDGWRLMTYDEWETIIAIDSPRSGSTVNSIPNVKTANIKVIDVDIDNKGYCCGKLLFPDGKTILGTTLTQINGNSQLLANELTEAQVNEYIQQGCAFLPCFGGFNTGAYSWYHPGTNGYYVNSTEKSGQINMIERSMFSINTSFAWGDIYKNDNVIVRLVK